MELLIVGMALGAMIGAGAVVIVDEHVYEQGVRDGRRERDEYAFDEAWRLAMLKGMHIGAYSVYCDMLGVRPAVASRVDASAAHKTGTR